MANEKRLIDGYALEKYFREKITHLVYNTGNFCILVDHVLHTVRNAPTMDAVEVMHGWWIDEYPYVRCSECNAEWINCRTDNEPKMFYYCPNCGAKMDGDGNDSLP